MISLHLATLLLTAVAIIYADHQGFEYLTGKKQTLNKKSVLITHWLVLVGLLGMVVTGYLLGRGAFTAYYLQRPEFLLKMFLVAVLFVNAVVISHLMHLATTTPFAELKKKQKIAMFVSGGISTACWLGAFTIGFFFL